MLILLALSSAGKISIKLMKPSALVQHALFIVIEVWGLGFSVVFPVVAAGADCDR